MSLTVTDPYGKNPYKRLKGEKKDALLKVTYRLCKVIKDTNAYWIIGDMTSVLGAVRAFKPELPVEPGLFALPIYGGEYEISKKGSDGKYDVTKHQPSLFEKTIYDLINGNESLWVGEDRYFTGSINFIPNMMCEAVDEAIMSNYIEINLLLNESSLKEQFPELPLYGGKSNSGNKGGKSWGLKPDEKLEFLKAQLEKDVQSVVHSKGQTLAILVDQVIKEHADCPRFAEIYFDMLIACVR